MASVVITESVLKPAIEKKFEHITHIAVSFTQKGFALCNYIRRDEAKERIEIIFTKSELQEWINTDLIGVKAIGDSYSSSK